MAANGQLLIFGKYGQNSAEAYPGVCVGGWVVSLVFYRSHQDIDRWLEALADCDDRVSRGALIMAMMKPFYVKWADRFYRELRQTRYAASTIEKRLPDTTTRSELSCALSKGFDLAIYLGHGRSRGWSGYRGFRWEHVEESRRWTPVGTLVSLSCSALKQDKADSVPAGLNWVMSGRSCAFLGACDAIEIQPLVTIARIMLELLCSSSVHRLDDLLRATDRRVVQLDRLELTANWSRFRLIGNPMQSLNPR
jgi:hypothetical protein